MVVMEFILTDIISLNYHRNIFTAITSAHNYITVELDIPETYYVDFVYTTEKDRLLKA